MRYGPQKEDPKEITMNASADIDALMQESKQGTVIIENVFCGVLYLKLGEFYVLGYIPVSGCLS